MLLAGQIITGGGWKARAIAATKGNQSLLGVIVLAVLGKAPDHAPRIVSPYAAIDKDGMVWAGFEDRDKVAEVRVICHIEDLISNFRGLADALKLGDKDREAMFKDLRAWLPKDGRAAPSFLG